MNMKRDPRNLEESLGYLIGRAGRAMANRLNHHFENAGYDVTCEQWAILNSLWKKNGQTQKELAGCTCKDKTSITRLVDGMERRKLVTRISSKMDAREKFITLTEKGKTLRQKLVRQINKTLDEAKKSISSNDIELCKDILRKIYENLNENS